MSFASTVLKSSRVLFFVFFAFCFLLDSFLVSFSNKLNVKKKCSVYICWFQSPDNDILLKPLVNKNSSNKLLLEAKSSRPRTLLLLLLLWMFAIYIYCYLSEGDMVGVSSIGKVRQQCEEPLFGSLCDSGTLHFIYLLISRDVPPFSTLPLSLILIISVRFGCRGGKESHTAEQRFLPSITLW